MADYLGSHNYGKDDFDVYSQDPEWQKINAELQNELGYEVTQQIDSDGFTEPSIDELMNQPVVDDFPASQDVSSDSGITPEAQRELDLLQAGNAAINERLEAKADDYRDKEFSEEEIAEMLIADKLQYQKEFLEDAFPGQAVDPNIFRHVGDGVTEVSDNASFPIEDQSADGNAAENANPDLAGEISDSEINEISPLENLEGWLDDINPNFDEFDIDSPYCNNCGSCAYAVNQRLEGNTDICATAENINYNSEMEALTGMQQVSMSPQEIEERLLSEGSGAHAIIGIDRAEGAGHWFNAANIDGKVVAIDGQDGAVHDWPPDYGDVVNWEMSVEKEEQHG
jgi:hypothetical protein